MELHQLEYLVAVAEEGSFTRAAERVHVAQPGVSAQIGRLERELGQQLFDRTGRAVRLTEVGAAVLPYARAALGAVGGARQAVDELTGLLHGRVAIGMITACSITTLFDLLADFHRQHPAVEISLAEASSDELAAALRDGRLDLALIGVGGISSGADAYEKIRAGASLVQLYTALAFEGPALIARIKREMLRLMDRDGIAQLANAIGLEVR